MTANNSLGKMPTPYQEANRYIENAKQTLKEKAGKKDGEYADVKYVSEKYNEADFLLLMLKVLKKKLNFKSINKSISLQP